MLLADFHAITQKNDWQSKAAEMLNHVGYPAETVEAFDTYWIEAGHHIRSQIGNDSVLMQLLRHLLPTYNGQAIELFRGENKTRWEQKAVGLAWTSNRETARMFGSGLNAVRSGGILLRAWFEPEAIVAGPNPHSTYLGEDQYTVDPSLLINIDTLEFYPAAT